jgi:hypothetical protein
MNAIFFRHANGARRILNSSCTGRALRFSAVKPVNSALEFSVLKNQWMSNRRQRNPDVCTKHRIARVSPRRVPEAGSEAVEVSVA